MSKYLRLEKAKESFVYRELVDAAIKRLEKDGFFSKDSILEDTGLDVVGETIRWDYIKRIIDDDLGNELIPLAAAFFKRHSKEDERNYPNRYLATGYGKRTAGFALIDDRNGHFFVQRLKTKKAIVDGTQKSLEGTAEIGRQAGIEPPDEVPMIEAESSAPES